MKKTTIKIGAIPAIIWGEPTDKVYLYIHGKMGNKEEAEPFASIACSKGWQVLSIDLPGHGERTAESERFFPWYIVPELESVWTYVSENWESVSLYAVSLGAWFSMLSFYNKSVKKALFVSPVLDMELLIENMMKWAGITYEQLQKEKIISTDFGETLSWEYYMYAKEHHIQRWNCETEILYGENDNMTERSIVESFCERFSCGLTVMEKGEHWFHTEKQIEKQRQWEIKNLML